MDIEISKVKLYRTIGENIRRLRLERKLTIDELSEYLGISTSFLGLVERGVRGFSLIRLLKLSKLLNLSLDDIVCELNNKNSYTEEENLFKVIECMVRQLDYKEQERLIIIIKASFPCWYNVE